MTYAPSELRYDDMPYRRVGRSGLKLPAISLGLWHNFGGETPQDHQRAMLRRAFDLGIVHFDLANNYGPPYGTAELNFGSIFAQDFKSLRDEMIISSKAGWDMWPGPYGDFGSRKYLVASCDQSLKRMGVDYVDIFYHHRPDPDTPLEETMGALDYIVRSGRALYVGLSSYNSEQTRKAAKILADMGTPCLIHQPSYSMLNRWIERDGLVETLDEAGIGSIVFSPLAQGLLTNRYLDGIPTGSRAAEDKFLPAASVNENSQAALRALSNLAKERGQTLAQMALAWVLRNGRITSALIGASRVSQIEECVAATQNLSFTDAELMKIDQLANEEQFAAWAKET